LTVPAESWGTYSSEKTKWPSGLSYTDEFRTCKAEILFLNLSEIELFSTGIVQVFGNDQDPKCRMRKACESATLLLTDS
jgi:hypothetical protein